MIDAVQILWSPAGVTLSALDPLELVDVTDGDRAYSSWYSHGIVALDVSHPTRPAKVGQFVSPPPAGAEPPIPLVWGVAIDPETGTIYGSDIDSGLWIVRPTGDARPSLGS